MCAIYDLQLEENLKRTRRTRRFGVGEGNGEERRGEGRRGK
jgi:hypothetical protein